MRNASAQLIALLHGSNTYMMADLYTVALRSGEVLRWTGADTDLTLGTDTFSCDGPIVERGSTRLRVGLEVDTLDITLKTGDNPPYQLAGQPLPAAARNGAFDGARVTLQRVFMPTWGDTSYGALLLYEGEVAASDPTRHTVALTIKSEIDRLNTPMPATLLKPGCANMVYDTNCGLDRAAWTVTGTVGASPSKTVIPSGLAQADNYFDLGVLAMTSGPAAGSRRAIRAYSGGTFTLSMPLDKVPDSGDSFTVYPGCYRTKAACDAKGNDKFRGYPYVPVPEQAR